MEWLFDTHGFMLRQHCGVGWTDSLRLVYKFSNLVIACCYFSIPLMFLFFWYKRRNDITQPWILFVFACTIFLSAFTFFDEVLVFYWSPYRFYTLISIATSLLSFLSACLLPKVILTILKLPSREIIHKLNGELNRLLLKERIEKMATEEKRAKLAQKVEILEGMLETNAWMHDRGTAMAQLKEMLLTIGPEKPKE